MDNNTNEDYQYMISACVLVHDLEAYHKWQKEKLKMETKDEPLFRLRKLVNYLNLISGDICCTIDLIGLAEKNSWFPMEKVEQRLEYHGCEDIYELKELSWRVEERRRSVLVEIVNREVAASNKKQKKAMEVNK